ncbi:hypothetical protein ANN_26598 [Periplaneta americana]|uniref:Uncharacterized protein n=1 Tax=Periplaneta americana TaxID=6978 RepID=A0ABQ8RYS8_PERAM|nr:hypothetical protein ANN_26598 [Periplaneta americana]
MYSNQEPAEVHFMYGKADGNAALARRLCQERYYDDGDRELGMMSNRASQHSRFSDTVLQVSSGGGAALERGGLLSCIIRYQSAQGRAFLFPNAQRIE